MPKPPTTTAVHPSPNFTLRLVICMNHKHSSAVLKQWHHGKPRKTTAAPVPSVSAMLLHCTMAPLHGQICCRAGLSACSASIAAHEDYRTRVLYAEHITQQAPANQLLVQHENSRRRCQRFHMSHVQYLSSLGFRVGEPGFQDQATTTGDENKLHILVHLRRLHSQRSWQPEQPREQGASRLQLGQIMLHLMANQPTCPSGYKSAKTRYHRPGLA